MFFRKITSKSNGKEYTYLKLIENYREGDKVRQRVIANLGSLEKLTPDKVNGLIAGLSKICGVSRQSNMISTKKVLRYGEILAIHKIWELLGVESAVKSVISKHEHDIEVPLLTEIMAINQIIKPKHKQAISDWYQCLYMPELENRELTPHHFHRALDVLNQYKEDLEKIIYNNLTALLQINTDLAFCRLTSGAIEPAPREELNLSAYSKYILGESQENEKADFGLLVSRDGMPLGHKVIRGTGEETNYRSISEYLKKVFGIDKCIFVGERSFANNPGLEVLIAQGYNYIIGYKHTTDKGQNLVVSVLQSGMDDFKKISEDLWFKDVQDGNIKYIVCYNPIAAKQMKAILNERLDAIESELNAVRLAVYEKRDLITTNHPILDDVYCRKYIQWSYKESDREFIYHRKKDLINRDGDLAGAYLLETNNEFLRSGEIVKAYTSLVYLGESFKEIKNFEPWPNYLYTETRISANLFICVLSAMLEKTMEILIRQSGLNVNTRQALLMLEEIKVAVNELGDREVKSVTSISQTQQEVLNAIGLAREQRV